MGCPLDHPNATCDILHYGSSSPDISGVQFTLDEDWEAGHRGLLTTGSITRWTHIGQFSASLDIRDAYSPAAPGSDALGNPADTIYLPSFAAFVGGTGVAYAVIFVCRMGLGGANDNKTAHLQRQAINNWPQTEL